MRVTFFLLQFHFLNSSRSILMYIYVNFHIVFIRYLLILNLLSSIELRQPAELHI